MVQQGERDMKQILVELEQSAPLVEQMSEVLEAWQSGRYMTLLIHIFSGVPDEEWRKKKYDMPLLYHLPPMAMSSTWQISAQSSELPSVSVLPSRVCQAS